MAEAFLKVKAHTEDNPVYTKANLLLKAIEQVLPNKTPTLYYASILDLVENPQDILHQEASLILLACSLQPISISLLQKEFDRIKNDVIHLLREDSPYLGKYSVKVLERLIQVIPKEEWQNWGEKAKIFEIMVDLIMHPNSHARKQAITSLVKLLRKGLIDVPIILEYTVNKMNEYMDMQQTHAKTESLIYILQFLSAFLQMLPLDSTIFLASKVMSLATLNLTINLSTQAFLTLETLFAGTKLPLDVIHRFVIDLLENPPLSGGNEKLQIAYMQALSQAVYHFNSLDSAECYKVLSQSISTLTEYLLSNQLDVQHAASNSLVSVISRCITEKHAKELNPLDELALSFDVLNIEDIGVLPIQRITATMVYLLNERFSDILEMIFPILAIFIERLGPNSEHIVQRLLQEIDQLAVKNHKYETFSRLIGTAINTLGVSKFFNIIPLQMNLVSLEDPNFLEKSRSWILPILIDHLNNGDLGFFFAKMFPIAEQIERSQNQALNEGLVTASKKYQALIEQIWSTFPAFCKIKYWTQEGQNYLHSLLPTLSKIIARGTYLRPYILKGLEVCLQLRNLQIFESVQDKFIPVLFNSYLSSPNKEVLSFIQKYPAHPDYAEKLLKMLMDKSLKIKRDENGKMQDILLHMNLIIKMLPKLKLISESDKEILIRFSNVFIENDQGKMQKKAYDVMRLVCKADYKLVESIVLSNSITKCHEVARKARLRVFDELANHWNYQELTEKLNVLIIEIMHSLRSNSKKTREISKGFVIKIGQFMSNQGQFLILLNTVLSGLASVIDTTKSATIDILSCLLHYFIKNQEQSGLNLFESYESQQNYLCELCTTISYLLADPSKEVNRAVLKFFKEIISLLSVEKVISILDKILGGIFSNMVEKNTLKVKVRYVIEKLLKKIGYEELEKRFPEKHKKLLHYIARDVRKKHKKEIKAKKEKHEKDEEMIDIDNPTREEKQAPQPALPREYHFMNELDIPAMPKIKQKTQTNKSKDVQIVGGKFVINEDAEKRQRSDSENEEQTDEVLYKKRKVNDDGIVVNSTGDEYKSNSAKGDMNKPGKATPHAYVQFNAKILNKRKRVKIANKVNNLIKTAKQGVLKGLKARKRKNA